MYVIFLLLLLSSCTSSADINNGLALLKIKEQLGNPEGLSTWVEGFDFCNDSANTWAAHIDCTSSGRVRNLRISNMREIYAPFPKAICNLPPDLVHGSGATLIVNYNSIASEIPQSYRWTNICFYFQIPPKFASDLSRLSLQVCTFLHIVTCTTPTWLNSRHSACQSFKSWPTLSRDPGSALAQDLLNLDLKFNTLCGEIPQKEGSPWQHQDIFIFIGNPCLCGNPMPPCFNPGPGPSPAPAPSRLVLEALRFYSNAFD
ncbi:Polygalacturonase inhibitor [Rhynchospora pubera]|uniref:Polygalacturonase inhibitor n=1 Tax=Rhynchospora pubera TaxID=906938 RepID=A0AAV8F6L4_9POAL|nr:Polygalacturonase inhibitor [Rhynchospora pubera]